MELVNIAEPRVVNGEVLTSSDNVHALYMPHWPLDPVVIRLEFKAGLSLYEIAQELSPKFFDRLSIWIDGDYFPRQYWHRVRPKPGVEILIKKTPRGGGGGGKAIRIVAMIAIIALAIAVPYALPAALTATPVLGSLTVGGLISAGILIGGSLLLNALVPPPRPRLDRIGGSFPTQDSPTYFISGATNQIRPFGVIPRVLGKHRMTPPYAAQPFTEIVGNDQYVRMLFCWGYGPLTISDLRIGETSLDNFTNIEFFHHQGYAGKNPPFNLVTQDVYEDPLQVTVAQASSWVIRTTQPDCDEFSIDITFLAGLVQIDDQGNRITRTVDFEVKYAPTGTTNFEAQGQSFGLRETPQLSVNPDVVYINGWWTLVGMHAFNGSIYVADGPYEYITQDGQIIGGGYPSIPENILPLAWVRRKAGVDNVVAADITDIRTQYPRTGSYAQGSSDLYNLPDFAPSAQSPASRKLNIASGTLLQLGLSVSAASTSAVRRYMRIKPTTSGQFDIHIRRLTADATSTQISDIATWTALRSVTYASPVDIAGLVFTEMRAKATDQFNGPISEFNGVVQSVLPDWNQGTSAWVTRATSSPAACFRAVLQDAANNIQAPDGRVDLVSLQEWAEYCFANGFEFNQVRDFESSVYDTLRDIASVGRAHPSRRNGTKWGVAIDKSQTAVKQMFTARNIRDYTIEKALTEIPHAWRVRFFNRDKDWRQDERRVFNDGYSDSNATKYQELELIGVTHPDHIWKDGRYHLAVIKLRPELHSFIVFMEQLACERGNRIAANHDVPLYGLGAARIKTINSSGGSATSIVTDKPFTADPALQYSIRIRSVTADVNGGYVRYYNVTPQSIDSYGMSSLLAFDTSVPSFPFEVGDLVTYGTRGLEATDLIIKEIIPVDDEQARVVCWQYSEGIYTSDTEDIPEFQSNISLPLYKTALPGIASLISDESALQILPDGSWKPRIMVTMASAAVRFAELVYIESWYQLTGSQESPVIERNTIANVFYLNHVEEGKTYRIKHRYVDSSGAPNPWNQEVDHTVVGATSKPPSIDSTTVVRDGDVIRWAYPVIPNDFLGFKVYFNYGTSKELSTAQAAHTGYLSSNEFALTNFHSGVVTLLVVAVDIAGNESATAGWISLNFGDLFTANLLEYYDDDAAGFPGTKVNCTVTGGDLVATDANSYLPNNTEQYLGGTSQDSATYLPTNTSTFTYTTTFNLTNLDNTKGRLLLDLVVVGEYSIRYRLAESPTYINDLADTATYLPVNGDPYLPTRTPSTWASWPGSVDVIPNFAAADFEFTVYGAATPTYIDQLNIIYDIEDQAEYINDFVVGPSGSRLILQKSYRIIKNIRLTLQSDGGLATGARVVDKDPVLGPLIETYYDAPATLTSGLVDAEVIGIPA